MLDGMRRRSCAVASGWVTSSTRQRLRGTAASAAQPTIAMAHACASLYRRAGYQRGCRVPSGSRPRSPRIISASLSARGLSGGTFAKSAVRSAMTSSTESSPLGSGRNISLCRRTLSRFVALGLFGRTPRTALSRELGARCGGRGAGTQAGPRPGLVTCAIACTSSRY